MPLLISFPKTARSSSWVLFWLSTAVGVTMVGLGIIWPLIPVYAVEMGAGGIQVGLIIAAFNVARSGANPIVGRFSDRWGRKSFIASGLFLYASLSILYVLAYSVETLIGVRLIHGTATVLVTPVAMALVAEIAPKDRLGLYIGTLQMAMMLGVGAGPVLGGVIRDLFGLNAAFFTMGGLALLTLIGVSISIPGQRQLEPLHAEKIDRKPLHKIIRNRIVQSLFLIRLFAAAGQGSVYTFLPLLAMRINLTSTEVGIVLSTNVFLIAILQRICGSLADRIDPAIMMFTGTFVSGIAVACMPFADGFQAVLALNILMGAANGFAAPGGFVIAGRLGRKVGMGSMMGLFDAAWSLGLIVSPVLSGIILDTLGMGDIFYIGGALIFAGTILTLLFYLSHYRNYQEIKPSVRASTERLKT
jgi:MFS family permease